DKGFQLDIYAEKSGYKSVVTYNVKRIEKYTDSSIILEMKNEKISFLGKSLECITYASEAIEIDGDIEEIHFSKIKGGANV
ncbi:MAG: YabP/YqfC family sporulation protein, partial [Clostridia bacterium]|nr:YabP/YqfC family sporulation protein [Clostridia bacterium]